MPIVGDVLAGRYRIDAPIGAGGMASVYRAYDLRLEREVAVKVLLPNLAADPALAERFGREALALAATSHPSVVKVFDVEPGDPATGREPFYVMESCDGGSLADRLAARDSLEPDELVAAIAAVAAGLADLHRRGFVHRDVKPHNILFDQGRARLADFGLARPEHGSELTSLTATGATVGTLAYLAPELLRGEPATPASDVYGLGVVAFLGLTGKLPRPAAAMTDLVESHARPAPIVSSMGPQLGPAFDAPVAAALATDPAVRPAPITFAEGLAGALAPGAAAAAALAPAAAAVAEPGTFNAAADMGSVPLASPMAVPNDPGTATVLDIQPEWPADAPGPTPAQRPRRPIALVAGGAVLLSLLAGFVLSTLLGNGDPGPGVDRPAPTAATPVTSPSIAATPSATLQPTPAPTPPPEVDPAADAYAILDRVDAAIDDLADEDGVRDRDLDALRRRAGAVRESLVAGDYREALARTAQLNEELDRVDDRVEGDAMDELKDAVSNLDEAIPAG